MLIKFIYQIFSVLNAFLHDSKERFLRTKIQNSEVLKTQTLLKIIFSQKVFRFEFSSGCIRVDVSCNSLSRLRSSHSVNVSSISNLMGNKFEKWSCFGLAESYQPARSSAVCPSASNELFWLLTLLYVLRTNKKLFNFSIDRKHRF